MPRRWRASAEEAGWSTPMKADNLNAEKTECQHRRGGLVNSNKDGRTHHQEGKELKTEEVGLTTPIKANDLIIEKAKSQRHIDELINTDKGG